MGAGHGDIFLLLLWIRVKHILDSIWFEQIGSIYKKKKKKKSKCGGIKWEVQQVSVNVIDQKVLL